MSVAFTAHNIRLDNGTFTKPENGSDMTSDQWFVSARALLNSLFPGDKSRYRLVDLGCLEGGYAVEFARLGFQVTGLEVRESNMAACRYVKANTSLPNLEFVQDDAWNLSKYGRFDVVFCCGLFYHLDRPKQFLEMLASFTNRVLILQTHFASLSDTDTYAPIRPAILGKILRPIVGGPLLVQQQRGQAKTTSEKFGLSPLTENEGLRGRWYTEFASEDQFQQREAN
jgi:SAM-dependent methyltransferase